jgi:hypothetical protein
MQGEDSTFGKFKAGEVDVAIDDVSAIGTSRPHFQLLGFVEVASLGSK